MKKAKFLKDLKEELDSLPKDEIDDIISDYEEYFTLGKKKKRKEEDIAKALGSPKHLAKQLKAEYHVKKAQKEKTIKNTANAALAVTGVALFNIIVVMGPFIGFAAVIVSLYIAALAIIFSGMATIAGGVLVSVHVNVLLGIATSFAGATLGAFGIMFGIGTWYLSKLFIRITIKYLSLNKKIIRGELK